MSLIATATSAFVAALTGAPGVANVSRIKLRPLASNAVGCVVVRPLQSEVTGSDFAPGYPVSWQTTIVVECYARAPSSVAPDTAIDALISAVYAALMLDPTLGGQVIHLDPQSLTYDFDADADNTVAAIFHFTVLQRANPGTF